MSESYISRRGGSGGSSLAIYTGATLPSTKTYGVYANTGSNAVNNTVITQFVAGAGTSSSYGINNTYGNVAHQIGINNEETIIYYTGSGTKTYNHMIYAASLSTGVCTALVEDRMYGDAAFLNKGNNTFWFINGAGTDSSSDWNNGDIYTFSPSGNTLTKHLNTDVISDPYNIGLYNNTLCLAVYGGRNSSTSYTSFLQYSISGNSISVLWYTTGTSNYVNGRNCYYTLCGDTFYGTSTSGGNLPAFTVGIDAALRYITTHTGTIRKGTQWYYSGYLYVYQNGSIFQRLNLNSTTSAWESITSSYPGFYGSWNTPAIIGGDIYSFGSSATTIAKYSIAGDSYTSGTVVIEADGYNNIGTIISDNKQRVDIGVKGVYYSNGSTLTKITGSVRKLGGAWTTIAG